MVGYWICVDKNIVYSNSLADAAVCIGNGNLYICNCNVDKYKNMAQER